MTWVKICGITNLEDARVAVEAGADALGFVFYERSPRNVSIETARAIVQEMPAKVEKVGVFVNGSGFGPVDTTRKAGLTAIQNTVGSDGSVDVSSEMMIAMGGFQHPPKVFVALPASWILEDVHRVAYLAERFSHLRRDSASGYSRYEGCFDTFFLDSGTLEQPGGTGQKFDWEKAREIAEHLDKSGLKLVVAGGLCPDNVSEAIQVLRPWGVDVSSGVEARPGKKDPEKVRAFMKAVREADKVNQN